MHRIPPLRPAAWRFLVAGALVLAPSPLVLGATRMGDCPGVGDCCVSHATPGCNDSSCCNEVCAQDPFCCTSGWDSFCVDSADELCSICGPVCGDTICEPGETWPTCPECPRVVTCPGVGDCCDDHLSNGCTDERCCTLVCDADPSCCQSGWDVICVNEAHALCDGLCTPRCGDALCERGESWPECPECPPIVACPGVGDCCDVHLSIGCTDEACCDAVCAIDAFCCDSSWDAGCVDVAGRACGCNPGIPADLDGDGSVGQADLAILLGDWGSSGGASDIDADGEVGQQDLALLLGAWSEEPG